jgi:hypothetical protein
MSARNREWLSYLLFANEPGRPRIPPSNQPYTEENWQHISEDVNPKDSDPFDIEDFEENSAGILSPEKLDEALNFQTLKTEFDQQRELILQDPIRVYITCFEGFTELK